MIIKQQIETKINDAFQPAYLEVINESDRHNVPPGSESHFKVVLVSSQFHGLRPVQRHQKVYQLLNEEMAGSVHALALHLYTPQEWDETQNAPDSPNCMGGGKRDH